jgi:hypothetical protein
MSCVIYVYLKGLIQCDRTIASVCWTVEFTIPIDWDAIRPPVISAALFFVSGKFTVWHGQLKSLQRSICNRALNCCYFFRISCTFLLIYTVCLGNILMNISFWWQLFKSYSETVKISEWICLIKHIQTHIPVINIKIGVVSPVVCCFVWICYKHGNSYIL